MRAITVSVDYADLLAVTLPYNRHHFAEMMIVTSSCDVKTRRIAEFYNTKLFVTDSFYRDGADFNKWYALEEALDSYGRHGLLVLIDSDIMWPQNPPEFKYIRGCLYTPRYRIMRDTSKPIPDEKDWNRFPLHRGKSKWGGYSHIFYASDSVLGKPPWYEINWRHAGRADTIFQKKWPKERKRRPPWDAFHIGEAGKNWCGRVTPYLDGSVDSEAAYRATRLRKFLAIRNSKRRQSDMFAHEKM